MKRRTFLKAVGATLALPALPVAKTEELTEEALLQFCDDIKSGKVYLPPMAAVAYDDTRFSDLISRKMVKQSG